MEGIIMKSIKAKILLPIFILAFFGLLSVATAVYGVHRVYNSGMEISNNYLDTIEVVADLTESTQTLMRLSYNYILADGQTARDSVSKQIDAEKADIDSLMSSYESSLDDNEKEAYQKFKSDYESYLAKYNTLVKYVETEQTANATNVANNDLVSLSSKLEEDLDAMIMVESDAADEAEVGMKAVYVSGIVIGVVCLVIIAVLLVLAYVVCRFSVVKPIVEAEERVREIVSLINDKNGDLTLRVDVKSDDEVGRLSEGINLFLEKLQEIIGTIVKGTEDLSGVVTTVTENVATSNDNAQDVSSALEELSATMEEIAATVQNVTDNAESVNDEVLNIADKSEEMNVQARDMRVRADELAKKATDNKKVTDDMISEIMDSFKQAIEESKSVERVNELTGEILSISSQTNLLALNASIEAARAGEAGRGFAVVADEIRELADSSRDTANNIQAINEHVTKAVHALVDNSNAIIKFIDETVLPDYDNFVKSGEQYNEDASYVSETMEDFSEKTEQLKQIMKKIVESIEGISKAVEESANAVTSSAMSTSSLVGDMQSIDVQMNNSKATVDDLMVEADVFKKF
jgi:methyl-accepting chemotaxis protein